MIAVNNGMVDARELHAFLNVGQHFASWIARKIEDADLVPEKDFFLRVGKSSGGRPTDDYSLTINAAKEICLLQRGPLSKELRRHLIKLDDKVSNWELVTTEQAAYMVKVSHCLQYITSQKEAYELHQTSFVSQSTAKNPYAEFAMYRSRITGWDKQKVEEAFNNWLLTQGRATSKLKTQIDRINAMDVGEAIRIAVMDILYANGADGEMTEKFAAAIKRMSQALGLKPYRGNETTLFQQKQDLMEVSKIKLIG